MNIFFDPKQTNSKRQVLNGARRFYARICEIVPLLSAEGEETSALWQFEAFDAAWFDKRLLELSSGNTNIDYNEVPLFQLELRVNPKLFNKFSSLKTAAKHDDQLVERSAWLQITTSEISQNSPRSVADEFIAIFSNLFSEGVRTRLIEIQEASERILPHLMESVSTTGLHVAAAKEVETELRLIPRIDFIVVYDVGQGNAIGLCDASGVVLAYFDFGGGIGPNTFTYPNLLSSFCFSAKPPIILSHWHADHWSSAIRNPTSLECTWIAPIQSVGPVQRAMMATVSVKGRLLLIPSNYRPRWCRQFYLELCNGANLNNSGISLTLSERQRGNGKLMLFPGDADYRYIPTFEPSSKYMSIVVPHHGANLSSTLRPRCPTLPSSRLVYSYGLGNTYSHPTEINRRAYVAAGWRDSRTLGATSTTETRETANRIPPNLGHVLLTWNPVQQLPIGPCQGRLCPSAQQD